MALSYLYVRVVLLMVLLGISLCQTETSTKLTTEEMLETYKTNFKTAIAVERSEKKQTKHLTEEFNVKLVLKMTEYRLQMIFHQNHSLRQDANEKWLQCVETKSNKITQIEDEYADEKTQCLSDAHAGITERKKSLKQITKEIRDWKKGYKYLLNLCKERHLINKEDSGECLVDYMQRDSYSTTLNRLLELLEVSLAELKHKAEESLADFEDCLQRTLSKFLTALRKLKGLLNRCYSKRNKVLEQKPVSPVGCEFLTKLKNCAAV